jgi:hypothetical protein
MKHHWMPEIARLGENGVSLDALKTSSSLSVYSKSGYKSPVGVRCRPQPNSPIEILSTNLFELDLKSLTFWSGTAGGGPRPSSETLARSFHHTL